MISVCMATYNGEKFLKEQIDSILIQLEDHDELIVSDDNSTDNTISIIESCEDSRIKLYSNKKSIKRKHPSINNFENAIEKAKGDYIFLADQDDIWCDKKVDMLIKYLNSTAMVVSDCFIVDEELRELHNSLFNLNNSKAGLWHNLKKNGYIGCCMAFKKEILQIALPFPKDIPLHDLWLGFVAELFYSSKFVSDKLILHRIHSSNASITGQKSSYSLFKKISFRLNCLKYIPLLIIRKFKNNH